MKRTALWLCLVIPALAASLPKAIVSIATEGEQRVIKSNGIPDHRPGDFPRRGNPNAIRAQAYEFHLPLKPQAADKPTPSGHAFFGVALNGVPFEPGTAEFWNFDSSSGWKYEALSGKIDLGLDDHMAHVQPNGAYHYHGLPTGLIEKRSSPTNDTMVLVGYAADGFPIYTEQAHSKAKDATSPLKKMRSSYQLREGKRDGGPGGKFDGTFTEDYEYKAGSGDLDECNGRFGVTPEFPKGTYYYCITTEFPQLSRQWKGTADPSFQKRGGPPDRPRGGPRRGGPGMLHPPGRPEDTFLPRTPF